MVAQLVEKINIITYNCFSIRRKIDIIRSLLVLCDVLVCQEIILAADDCYFLFGIDVNFMVDYVPSATSDSGEGRPTGGQAIFVKKKLNLSMDILFKTENFFAIKLSSNSTNFTLINVYMPANDGNSISDIKYQCALGELQAILDVSDVTNLVLVGDFNADHRRGGFWTYLRDFVSLNSLVMNDSFLHNDSFTYLSPAHNTTTWIDHVFSSSGTRLSNFKILYDLAIFDHMPMQFSLELPCLYVPDRPENEVEIEFTDWSMFNASVKQSYNCSFMQEIQKSNVLYDLNYVEGNSFFIDYFYDSIINALKYAAGPYKFSRVAQFKRVPGWNDFCKSIYICARDAFLTWVRNGKIRSVELFDNMKQTRKKIEKKVALDYCKKK